MLKKRDECLYSAGLLSRSRDEEANPSLNYTLPKASPIQSSESHALRWKLSRAGAEKLGR